MSRFLIRIPFLIVFGFGLESHGAQSDKPWDFEMPVSASGVISRMLSQERGMPDRVLTGYSFEFMPGLRKGKKLWGLHFDYHSYQPEDASDNLGGQNFKGQGYLLGLSLDYTFSEKFHLSSALDFIGEYQFHKTSLNLGNEKVEKPFSFQIKAHYFCFDTIPSLSVDGGFKFVSYAKFQTPSEERDNVTKQYMLSLGLTYYFSPPPPLKFELVPPTDPLNE